jgi:two-component system sensor histidine kinase HydH
VGKLFALFAGVVLIIFLTLRISIAAWVSPSSTTDTPDRPSAAWILETTLTAVLLISTVALCGGLFVRARRRDREQARVENRTEISQLASGLAHEIRNTLNAMHSQIALLRKEIPSEAGAACQRTGQLERAVAEMEKFVNEFLAFARPARERLEEVNLAALIAELLNFIALDLEQGRVKTVTELASDLPPVYVHAGKLKRALLNLFINARQAMPDGGTLTVRAQRGKRGEVVIEVQDTGCGIPEEDRSRIFQTFFSTKPDGTGLGLAVVKQTVEDFGGRITFASEVGRGTTFHLSLPTAQRRRLTRRRPGRFFRRESVDGGKEG